MKTVVRLQTFVSLWLDNRRYIRSFHIRTTADQSRLNIHNFITIIRALISQYSKEIKKSRNL